MKKTLKRTLTGVCASLVLLTSSICAASGDTVGEPAPGYWEASEFYSYRSLNKLYNRIYRNLRIEDFEFYFNYKISMYNDYQSGYGANAWISEYIGDFYSSEFDKITLRLIQDITLDEFCKALDTPAYDGDIPESCSKDFEFLNLTEKNTFRTGSIIRYKGEDADEYPYDIKVVVYGDVTGGEDGLGDGKVDILDVVKMRKIIVNHLGKVIQQDQYLIFKAFTCTEWDGVCDITHVVAARSMIVNAK